MTITNCILSGHILFVTSAAFEDRVREAPNVAEADRKTDACQQEFQLRAPRLARMTDCSSYMTMSILRSLLALPSIQVRIVAVTGFVLVVVVVVMVFVRSHLHGFTGNSRTLIDYFARKHKSDGIPAIGEINELCHKRIRKSQGSECVVKGARRSRLVAFKTHLTNVYQSTHPLTSN